MEISTAGVTGGPHNARHGKLLAVCCVGGRLYKAMPTAIHILDRLNRTPTPTTLNFMTVTITPMTQKQIAAGILTLKRAYTIALRTERRLHDEIRRHRRQIKLTRDNPFFKHRHTIWQSHIDEFEALLSKNRPWMHLAQEIFVQWIRQFDECGPAPIHVYAALLSTHHVHVERAWAKGAKNLMGLIIYHTEDGASTADCISDDAVLHHAVTEVVIREMCRNSELQRTADNLLQEMAQDSLGRPLRQYQLTEFPNGQTVAKPVPPKLTVVKETDYSKQSAREMSERKIQLCVLTAYLAAKESYTEKACFEMLLEEVKSGPSVTEVDCLAIRQQIAVGFCLHKNHPTLTNEQVFDMAVDLTSQS
jgi:hypothetical protein